MEDVCVRVDAWQGVEQGMKKGVCVDEGRAWRQTTGPMGRVGRSSMEMLGTVGDNLGYSKLVANLLGAVICILLDWGFGIHCVWIHSMVCLAVST